MRPLKEARATAPPETAAPARPAERRGIESRVLEIVAGLVAELQGAPAPAGVTLDRSLERDLGIGSLERVELLLRLEQAFGVRLSDAAMMEAENPRNLAQAILTATPGAPAR
ncbi:MAG: phosphopantetheine-binding protein, partial [candidate division NC10 bacterium]